MRTGQRVAPLALPTLLFAAFLSSGSIKGDPRLSWIPIDLTLLLALALAGLIAWRLVQGGLTIPRPTGWILLLFALLTIPLFWTDWHPYAREKVTYFFTLTLLASIAPAFLIRSRRDLYQFFNALTLFGALLGFDALRTLAAGIDPNLRLSAFGANPIAFGRAIGIAFLWTALLGIEGRLPIPLALLGTGAAGILLIASGSRGPILGSLVGLTWAGIVISRRDYRSMLRLGLAILTIALALVIGLEAASKESGSRITQLTKGAMGSSELARLNGYQQSMAIIRANPLGTGWGGFASRVDPSMNGGDDRQYPHNLLIEVALEGGWLLGALVALYLLAALWRSAHPAQHSLETRALFVLLLFCLGNALVSGDLNDNRLLFALAAMGLYSRWEDDVRLQGGSPDLGA